MAQFTLLRNCTIVIRKTLRKRGSTVLVAKLLVISRLLHKTLSRNSNVPPYLETLRSQLAVLRQALITRINIRLAAPGTTMNGLVEALSAYCLATSSSLSDAIHHYLHTVRLEAVRKLVEKGRHNDIILGFKLYLQTLQQTSKLLDGTLSTALGNLTKNPLLSDPDILRLGELGIDILRIWVVTDIQHFTPWIKYDEKSVTEANKQLNKWSKAAFERFSLDVKLVLKSTEDFQGLLDLRRQLLEVWLPVQNSTSAHSALEVLEGIRDTLNQRLVDILRNQSQSLVSLGDKISAAVDGLSQNETQDTRQSLWDSNLAFMDYSDGAAEFKEEITNRVLGRGSKLLDILEVYESWLGTIRKRRDIINDLKKDNWEDLLEDEVDEDDIERINGVLKEDDPDTLLQEHGNTLTKGFSELQDSLGGVLDKLSGTRRSDQAALLLRMTREIQTSIPSSLLDGGTFAQDIIPRLHDIIAERVISQCPMSILTSSLIPEPSRCPGRTLWEGDTPLPIQPSPMAFKMLHQLVLAMEDLGPDLWNRPAIEQLKKELGKSIASSIQSSLERNSSDNRSATSDSSQCPSESEQKDETGSNENSDRALDSDVMRDSKIQLSFDVLYLDHALAVKESPGEESASELHPVAGLLQDQLELDNEAVQILEKRSRSYWERTRLLFGLLG